MRAVGNVYGILEEKKSWKKCTWKTEKEMEG
jgi:hypothetical protein